MDIESLENSLQSILKPELGVSVFAPTNQNMPEQTLAYATYDLLTINHIGRLQKGQIDTNGIRTFYEQYEVVFRIIAYGQNATGILQKLSRGLCKETVLEALLDANLPYSSKTAVRRLPEVISSRWEERAQMNVRFFTSSEDTDDVGFINSATIDGHYYNEKGDLVLTDTIDVNLT
jgi:hypothetical protein